MERSATAAQQPRLFEGEELDPAACAILDFEQGWWRQPGSKERAIRRRFGISAARYHQLLNRLIDEPEAMRYDPMLVRRLRRLREDRRAMRAGGRRGVEV
jgi:hypothetical protein